MIKKQIKRFPIIRSDFSSGISNTSFPKSLTQSRKRCITADLILIAGTLIILFFVFGYQQNSGINLSPVDEKSALFSISGESSRIIIGEDDDFISNREIFVSDGAEIKLEPGVYYLKIEGDFISDIKQLTVEEEGIVLELKKVGSVFWIVNKGEDALVGYYERGEHVGDFIFSGGKNE